MRGGRLDRCAAMLVWMVPDYHRYHIIGNKILISGHVIYQCVVCVDGIHIIIIPSGHLVCRTIPYLLIYTASAAAVVVLMSQPVA
jgi:hypothetical protein